MKTPLAWLQLTHQRKRTVVAVVGVAFTIVLIFMQLGFYGAVEATATQLYDKLDFDVLLVSPGYINLNKTGAFPRRQLYQAGGMAEVAEVVPVYIGFQLWRTPEPDPAKRLRRMVLVVGVQLADQVFSFPEVENGLSRLRKQDTALVDRLSRDILGPRAPGVVAEVGAVNVEVVGQFTLGGGFGADGLLVVNEQTFSRIGFGHPLSMVSLGLIRLRPGAVPDVMAGKLQELLPKDVMVLTRAEVIRREQQYWVSTTSVGIMFRLGVVMAMIAGMVFNYQVISSDVRNHFAEYATLKAMGYRRSYLSRVIMQQTLFLALLGYAAGLVVSIGLYEATRRTALLPIHMNLGRVVLVLVLAVAMCSVSGLLCLRKVHSADPADLF
jgi:putative ABC transport system permease protein